ETDLSFTPVLATKVEAAADGKSYIITVRDGVTWHDGQKFTADDLAFTIESYWKPISGGLALKSLTGAKALDEHRVEVTFAHPMPEFSFKFFMTGDVVLPKHVYAGSDIRTNPANNQVVGTGPWKLKEWVPRERMVLERFADYYEPNLPYMDGIQYKVLIELASRVAALRAKQVDFSQVAYEAVDQLKSDPSLTVLSRSRGWVRVGLINHSRKPLDDVRVRKALDMALDRNEIIEKGIGKADVSGPIPAGHPSYALKPEELPPYYLKPDIEGAKKLLADAGLANGFKIRLTIESEHPYIAKLVQVMQQNWKKINVDAQIIAMPSASISKAIGKDSGFDYDVRFTAWTFYPDADNYTYNWYHSQSSGMDSLGPRWNDKELDTMMDKARTMPDGAERRAAYVAIQKRLMDTVPTFWFHNEYYFEAIRNDLKGFLQNPPARRGLSMRTAWLDK
ncbi:MAG TPA: ABC transporter substrate-binding protein, partial [Chloroflexota bacterium]